jgi:hypothetical protein
MTSPRSVHDNALLTVRSRNALISIVWQRSAAAKVGATTYLCKRHRTLNPVMLARTLGILGNWRWALRLLRSGAVRKPKAATSRVFADLVLGRCGLSSISVVTWLFALHRYPLNFGSHCQFLAGGRMNKLGAQDIQRMTAPLPLVAEPVGAEVNSLSSYHPIDLGDPAA